MSVLRCPLTCPKFSHPEGHVILEIDLGGASKVYVYFFPCQYVEAVRNHVLGWQL
eukprot:NODE_2297_length_631_cov_25.932990_g1947_i0.p6 GENE.NODE_2297_length_631_cov_25.932990_g1947_i0~~NODE_2297_length_631_cov_25.932990_g1947_i0.p6  ORF type:complete len:55 (-),score=7.47 NODE_2297_length_631_cov_25.932990_g1947_i0:213-377(-)